MLNDINLEHAQRLAALTVKDVTKVYKHRANAKGACRCGCGGYYWYSSTAPDVDPTWQKVNDKRVAQVLTLVQANANKVKVADDSTWFDLEHTDGCSYTVYVD